MRNIGTMRSVEVGAEFMLHGREARKTFHMQHRTNGELVELFGAVQVGVQNPTTRWFDGDTPVYGIDDATAPRAVARGSDRAGGCG
jgi:hypothetical protein